MKDIFKKFILLSLTILMLLAMNININIINVINTELISICGVQIIKVA